MRYIKTFNENIDSFQDELLDFCEGNLAYLLDGDCEVKVTNNLGTRFKDVKYKVEIKFNEAEYWDEIKDYISSFLTRLNNKYELSTNVFNDNKCNIRFNFYDWSCSGIGYIEPLETTIKDIISDNFEIPKPSTYLDSDIPRIDNISFYIKSYKPKKNSFLTKIKSFFN